MHGVEINQEIIKKLNKRKIFFYEKGLDRLANIVMSKKNFSYSSVLPQRKTNARRIYIITVGTPLDKNKKCNLKFIKRVSTEVSKDIQHNDVVILRSTVKIGTTNNVVRKILNKSSKNFSLGFAPERTLEGKAMKELSVLPQIIGADDKKSYSDIINFFNKLKIKTVKVSSTETAELIKLVDNTQRDIIFSISNEVGLVANNFNIKASEVIAKGKIDYPRTNLFGLGPVGGPCLEKDSYIFSESINKNDTIAIASRNVNDQLIKDSLRLIYNFISKQIGLKNRISIGFLGLAFKGQPKTNDLRGALSIELIKNFCFHLPNYEIKYFDPLINLETINGFPIKKVDNIRQVFENSNLVIFPNNSLEFDKIPILNLIKLMEKKSMVYDYWARFDGLKKIESKYASWGNHYIFEKKSIKSIGNYE